MSIDDVNNPIIFFTTWFNEAQSEMGQSAEIAALATVDKNCRPSVRMINFKGIRGGGFSFFTNYESQKGEDLLLTPWASLVFHWPKSKRQVRIQGKCKKLNSTENESYFLSRDRNSQATVWVSKQSKQLPYSYEQFLQTCHQAETSLDQIHCPPYWGGYSIHPEQIEFWEGRAARRHRRTHFILSAGGWECSELFP